MEDNEKSKRNPGYKNLIPLTQRTKEEQRQLRVRGGKASVQARRAKRDSKKIMLQVLSSMPKLDKATLLNLKSMGIIGSGKNKDEYDIETIIQVAIAQRAMKGDVKAYQALQRTIGEDPVSRANKSKIDLERQIMEMQRPKDNENNVSGDGFMEALNSSAAKLFEDGDAGGDVPSNID